MELYQSMDDALEATKNEHCTYKCSCGETIMDCRCWSPDKLTVTINHGCDDCKGKHGN